MGGEIDLMLIPWGRFSDLQYPVVYSARLLAVT